MKGTAEAVSALSLEQKLKQAFHQADSSGSLSVSKRELYKALEAAGFTAFSTLEVTPRWDPHPWVTPRWDPTLTHRAVQRAGSASLQ